MACNTLLSKGTGYSSFISVKGKNWQDLSKSINSLKIFQDLQDQHGYSLPKGPVFMSPKTFAEALVDAMSDPSPVKTATLKGLLKLFDLKENIVHGAYGNRNSDTKSYMDAGISAEKIYLVNEKGILRRVSDGKRTSYLEHAKNVNQMYP